MEYNKEYDLDYMKTKRLKEQINLKNDELSKGIGQKIKCGVTDCIHNCIDDSTCRLECITVNVSSDRDHAKDMDGTCCKSFYSAGDLNQVEITGRD